MTYTRWTPENKHALQQAALAGQAALDALAVQLGCGQVTLRKAIVRFRFVRPASAHMPWGDGRRRKHARWTPEVEARIREAAGVHGGLARLATELEIAPNILYRHAERLGAVPPRGEEMRQAADEHGRGVKTCKQCGLTKGLLFFSTHSARKTPESVCKECARSGAYRNLRHALQKTTGHTHGKLSIDDLVARYSGQAGVCFYTGLPMPFDNKRTTPSVDRLDATEGYTLSNTVLCQRQVNLCKRELSFEEFVTLANLIAKKHPRDVSGVLSLTSP